MEFRTRCRIIPALFALTFCTVPVFAQDEPDPASAEETLSDPAVEQDPAGVIPGAPGGQSQQYAPLARGGGGGFAPPGQPGFGQSGMGFSPMIMQSPEMAKKMRAIMVLRQMWQLRLTAKDISAVLLPLRELAEAEKGLQVRSEKILEEERRALLTADPDGDPPDGVGDLMQRENDLFRIKSDDTWRAIDKSIGKSKTNGIRRLLGMGGQVLFNSPGDVFGGGGEVGRGSTRSGSGGGLGGAPSGGGGFGSDRGGAASGGGGLGGFGGGGGLDIPDDDFAQPPSGGGGIGGTTSRPRQNRAQGRSGGGGGIGGAPRPGGGGGMGGMGGGMGGMGGGMPGTGGMSMMPQMRVSITEFVGLLGEKLAAMKR